MVSSVEVVAIQGSGTDTITMLVSEGSVTMDAGRNITRTAELTFVPTTTMSAQQIYQYLMRPGVEIQIKRGLKVDGATEYVPLGVFVTDTADYSKGASASVKWSGSDRSKRISRAKFVDPFQIKSGTTLADAGTALIRSRYPSTVCDFSNVTATIQANVVFEAGDSSDPWACARNLFADHGYDLNFNGIGTARAVSVLDPNETDVDFDFGAGTTNLVTTADISGTLENTYNGVIATAESSGNYLPARAIVWDRDPTSPTCIFNGMGTVPYFYSSPSLVTEAMCQTAATTMLNKLKGRTDQFQWATIVNPALEPLDVVTVTINGTTSRLVIDSLTIPLKPADAMTATARVTVTQ